MPTTEPIVFPWRLDTSGYIRAADAADARTRAQFRRARRAQRELSQGFERIGASLKGLGAIAAGALGGLTLGKAVSEATDFDTKFRSVVSLFGDGEKAAASFGRPLEQVKRDLKDMSGALGTASDLTLSLYQNISGGVDATRALDAVRASAQLAAAGIADAQESTKLLTTIVNSFPNVARGFSGAADVLFNTVKLGNVEVAQLAQGLGNILPSAKLAKASLEETTAAVAALSKTQPAAIAMTNLKALFTSLVRESDKFAEAGINIQQIMSEQGLAGVLSVLRERFAGNEQALLGLLGSSEAVAAIVPLITEQYGDFNAALESHHNSAGAAAEASRQLTEGFKGMADELRARVNVALIELGTILLTEFKPQIETAAKALREFVGSKKFQRDVRDFARALASLTGFVMENREALTGLAKVAAAAFIGSKLSGFAMAATTALQGLTMAYSAATGGAAGLAGATRALSAAFHGALVSASAWLAVFVAINEGSKAYFRNQTRQIGLIVEQSKRTKELAQVISAIATVTGSTAGEVAEDYKSMDDVLAAHKAGVEEVRAAYDLLKQRASESAQEVRGSFAQSVEVLGSGAMGAQERLQRLAAELARLEEAGQGASVEASEIKDIIAKLGEESRGAAPKVDALRQRIDSLKASTGFLSASDARQRVSDLAAAFREIAAESGTAVAVRLVADEVANLVAEAERSGVPLQELGQNLTQIQGAIADERSKAVARVQELAAALEPLPIVLGDTGIKAKLLADEQAELEERAQRLEVATLRLGDSIFNLGMAAASGRAGLADLARGAVGIFAQVRAEGGSIKGALSSAFSGFGKGSKSDAAIAGIGASIDTLGRVVHDQSLSTGEKIGQTLGAGVGTGLGSFFGGPLGGAIGGKLGGAAGKFLGRVFGGKAGYKRVQDSVRKNLGVTLSDGTAQAIEDIKKSLGVSRNVAALIGLPDIIAESKIGADNFAKFAREAGKALAVAQSGGKGAAEVAATLSDTYGALIGKAAELGATGSAAFQDMLLAARESGEEIESVTAFIEGRLALALDGAVRLFEGLGKGASAGRLEDLSVILGDISDGFLSMGTDVEQLLPAIEKLIAKHQELGLEATRGFAKLVQQRNFIKDNQGTIDAVRAIKDIVVGLGESTFLTTEGFSALQREAVRAHGAFLANNATEEQALTAQAGLLQELVNKSIQRGETLDAETQAIVDQAAALGLVETAGTGMIATLQQGFQGVVNAIGEAFGKKMPEIFAGQFKPAVEAVEGSVRSLFDTVKGDSESAASTVTAAGETMASSLEASHASVVDSTKGAVSAVAGSAGSAIQQALSLASRGMSGILAKLHAVRAAAAEAGAAGGGGDAPHVPGAPNVPGRQHGGPVAAGRPYIVGEAGRELFVPRESGRIIPLGDNRAPRPAEKAQATGTGGGFPEVLTLVIDGQEFRAYLAGAAERGSRDGSWRLSARALVPG